jgi:hypothetical protein
MQLTEQPNLKPIGMEVSSLNLPTKIQPFMKRDQYLFTRIEQAKQFKLILEDTVIETIGIHSSITVKHPNVFGKNHRDFYYII